MNEKTLAAWWMPSRRLGSGLLQNPTFLVLLVALVQFLLWGVLSAFQTIAPSDDSLEQLLLSQEFKSNYGKHPPLPTWLLYAVSRAFGPSIAATYLLGALCAVAATLMLYFYARSVVGAPRAAFAAILVSDIVYLNVGTGNFNHNTVQIPFAMLAILLFHRVLTRMRWADWALFGAACGLMMLAKFSAVVLFASFGAYLLWTKRLYDTRVCIGIAVAVAVCMVVLAPYLLEVNGDNWSPNAYAKKAIFPHDGHRLEALMSVWNFAGSQVAKVAPALLVFIFARRGAARLTPQPMGAIPLPEFLTIVGFGPFALTVLLAILSGAHLLVAWGTTFHLLFTLWLVMVGPGAVDVSPLVLRRATVATVVTQCALLLLVTANGGILPSLNRNRHPVASPVPSALHSAVLDTWAAHCHTPLRYVLADVHTAAALALQFKGQPRAIDGNRPEIDKVVSKEARDADGAAVVALWSASGVPQSPVEELLATAGSRTTVSVPGANGSSREYSIGILAPTAGDGCGHRLRVDIAHDVKPSSTSIITSSGFRPDLTSTSKP
jgi:4-amino-4-deoxy-L-arabinose transferase-like glycosyltransferase